ncbi:MAG: DUF1566 domain-containing protein [Pseudomonadota bacterium]
MKSYVISLCAFVTIAVAFLASKTVHAQAFCFPDIPETSNSDEFTILNEQEVWHRASNLVFMRCSVGQTFDGNTCTGDATLFSWQDALALNRVQIQNENSLWRLPNVKELSVIVERNCVRPSINKSVFPETPPDEYWTSTPVRNDATRAWSIAFTNGTSSIKDQALTLHVRMVRLHLPSDIVPSS